MKTLHLALMGAAAGTVRAVIGGECENVVEAGDILSVGPLLHLDTEAGLERRRQWMRDLLAGCCPDPLDEEIFGDVGLERTRARAAAAEHLVVWAGDNADEQLLLRAVVDAAATISVVDVTAEEPGLCVGACSPDELRVALPRARRLCAQERTELAADWKRLVAAPDLVRTFEGGRVTGHGEDFYDGLLVRACPADFTSAARVVGETMGRSPFPVGDTFLAYRLRHLAAAGVFDLRGDREPLYLMEVRRRTRR